MSGPRSLLIMPANRADMLEKSVRIISADSLMMAERGLDGVSL